MVLGGIQQSCPTPSNLTVSNETTTSVDVTWTENGSTSDWELIYGIEGFDPQNEGDILAVTGTPEVTLSGLVHSTIYEVYVRSVCNENDVSSLLGPTRFSTECEAKTVPYSLTFEEGANCVTIENAGSGNNWGLVQGDMSGFTGIYAAYQYTGSAANAWLYTAEISLTAGVSYDISYKYGNNSTYYFEKMKVAYGTSPESTAMVNQLANHPNITGGQATPVQVTFTVPNDGVYYFGFNAYFDSHGHTLFVDDIFVDSCLRPSDLTVDDLTSNTADISWTARQYYSRFCRS